MQEDYKNNSPNSEIRITETNNSDKFNTKNITLSIEARNINDISQKIQQQMKQQFNISPANSQNQDTLIYDISKNTSAEDIMNTLSALVRTVFLYTTDKKEDPKKNTLTINAPEDIPNTLTTGAIEELWEEGDGQLATDTVAGKITPGSTIDPKTRY